jgi:hypothetical protein
MQEGVLVADAEVAIQPGNIQSESRIGVKAEPDGSLHFMERHCD